jgi:ribulose-5-phosphate 4-epimerase/fuculose-1-phosphate aldolase
MSYELMTNHELIAASGVMSNAGVSQIVDQLREKVAIACRILAREGLVDGILGHVSVRTTDNRMLVRCRGPRERGLAFTTSADVRLVDFDGEGEGEELVDGYSPPNELPIHAETYRARPEVGAVVHAHPRSALIWGLAGLEARPVFGAYNIPALRMALDGVPVFPRSILITRRELAAEMLASMSGRPICVLRGHGITVTGDSVEQATVRAVDLHTLLDVTVQLARLGAEPGLVPAEDLAELPDLGSAFNDMVTWRALAAHVGGV